MAARETTFELVRVASDGLTVSALVWQRFRRPMPGLVERVHADNPHLTLLPERLPAGTQLRMAIPAPAPEHEVARVSLYD